jgi:hypothetical protein
VLALSGREKYVAAVEDDALRDKVLALSGCETSVAVVEDDVLRCSEVIVGAYESLVFLGVSGRLAELLRDCAKLVSS